MIPQMRTSPDVVVISVSANSIRKLEHGNAEKLSIMAMSKIIDATLASHAKAAGILLPHQDFDYDSEEMWPLVKRTKSNRNLYLGIFDQVDQTKTETRLPVLVEYAGPSVFAADTLREYWRSVVRQSILVSYLGDQERNHLTTQIALDASNQAGKDRINSLIATSKAAFDSSLAARFIEDDDKALPPNFRINYQLPHTFLTIEASDLVEKGSDERLSGKIVLVGYTAMRIREGVFNEGTYVNSPWQSESNKISEESGLPLVYVHASAIENLMDGAWFQKVPFWINFAQLLLVSIASFLVWKSSKTGAIILYLGIFCLLIFIHCVVMATLNFIIPLGDTVFASLLVSTIGAFLHGQQETKMRAINEAKLHGERELSKTQAQFLDRFSTDLYLMNENVNGILKRWQPDPGALPNVKQAYQKAVESSIELKDYLDGMKQLASIDRNKGADVALQPVLLDDIFSRLSNQFTAKLAEKKLKVEFIGPEKITLWSDKWLLESILFNLLSNAIKYSPDGALVSVKTETVDKQHVLISVSDLGPGIAPEYQLSIFEKFYRIKDDNVYKIKGNGLGLYLSRFFARKLGTDITLNSTIGKGSTFSIVVNLLVRKRWWQ
jgi:signal transduction histidine kinase